MTPVFVDLDATVFAVRLGAALVAGAIVGLDRELVGKPAGFRTHALVSIGAALTVLVMVGASPGGGDALSRVIQGIITGIGFLGAGVIMQHKSEGRVEGLTTAASVWVAAGLGIACGAGQFELAAIVVAAVLVVLIGGHWVEVRMLNRLKGRSPDPE